MSRPPRARGLKREKVQDLSQEYAVAPPAGAWIETTCMVSQLKPALSVAPPAGAWIETHEA